MTSQLMKKVLSEVTSDCASRLLEYILCHQMALVEASTASEWLENAVPDGGRDKLCQVLVGKLDTFR